MYIRLSFKVVFLGFFFYRIHIFCKKKHNRFSVLGLMSYLRYLYVFVYSGVQHILRCVPFFFWFVFILCLGHPRLPVSLDCSFLIVPSIFSSVYYCKLVFNLQIVFTLM